MATPGKKRSTRLAMGVAAAGVATSVAGVAATQPASISASLVDLAALIVVGSSTNPSGAGVENFFQGKFNDPVYTGPNGDDIVYVDFWAGPLGIQQALDANAGEPNAIIASGWGAANASLLALANRPDLDQTVLVLDNDVARPDGGFGTRYPWFALIGVNPIPTPSDVPASAAVNIGYEYDYNSNAPADVLNPVAAVNSLAAYLYRHRDQAGLDLPVNADGTPAVQCDANTCAITASGAVLDCADTRCSSPEDRITAYITTRANTTYVTYTSDGLPLSRLIRDVFGDRVADFSEPLLKLIVDSAYYGGNPIPQDPSAYRPARLFPSPAAFLATVAKIPGAIAQGWKAATSATEPAATGTSQSEKSADASNAPQSSDAIDDSETVDPVEDPETVAPVEDPEAVEPSETESSDTPSDEKTKPQTNVVRNSDKAVPGTVGVDGDGDGDGDSTATDPESVESEDDSLSEDGDEPEQTDDDNAADPESDQSGESPDAGDDTDADDSGAAA